MEFRSLKALRALALAGAVALPAFTGAAGAEENKVLARVNGHEITTKEVELAADDVLPQLKDLPPRLRFPFLVEYLVERHLLAQLAVKEGMTDNEEYKRRLAFYQAKALRDAYFAAKLKPMVTEDRVKATYDEQAAKVPPEERARAQHILVATEKEAQDIKARLEKGEKFEELAKQYSLDGSKDYGGDLGYFTAGEMVPEFSKAVFALKEGEVSQPVKTEFGWHIIKLEDRRAGGPQPYDQVKEPIRMVLLRKAVQDKLLELRKEAKIEVLDPDLKKLQEETEKKRDEIDKKIEEQQNNGQGEAATSGKGDKAN
ncbi:MAG: peptidylprolyl isomerase [Parvibaculaceae bacterium]